MKVKLITLRQLREWLKLEEMSPYILPLNFIYGRTGTIMDWFLRINILVFTLVWFLYFKKKSDAENLPMGKITQSLILDTEKSNCII